VIHSIALDQRRVLPVSTVQSGCYDLRNVALSVPTVVGRCGATDRIQLDLWPKEMQGLRKSGLTLRQTLETVMGRIGRG
jgi:L-lactate dehydrogenase